MRVPKLLWVASFLVGCAYQGTRAPTRSPEPKADVVAAPRPKAPPVKVEEAHVTARLPIDGESALVLVDVPTGQALIAREDAFVRGMSALDRKLRIGKAEASESELLAHFAAQVRPFREGHLARLEAAAATIGKNIAREQLNLDLGGDVPLVLTSGAEEAGNRVGVAYTREGVIYLNEKALEEDPTYLLTHELFHVYSQRHPEARDALYAAIGFHRLKAPILWPAHVEARRISSPDAPTCEHAIRVRYQGKSVLAAYVGSSEAPDAQGELLDLVSTYYVVLDGERARDDALLANYHLFEGFFEQVGRNTGYLAGPEEILADNFEILLEHPERARTPALLETLRKVLRAP